MKNLRDEKLPKNKTERPEKVVDDLNPTKDGEASQKAHGASNQTQLGFHRHL